MIIILVLTPELKTSNWVQTQSGLPWNMSGKEQHNQRFRHSAPYQITSRSGPAQWPYNPCEQASPQWSCMMNKSMKKSYAFNFHQAQTKNEIGPNSSRISLAQCRYYACVNGPEHTAQSINYIIHICIYISWTHPTAGRLTVAFIRRTGNIVCIIYIL